ncbi:MAG: hypothetical protein KVP17_000112 [Porospora cf. gigantea B]|uniref:uncharacterized protein n=1 Tax=Porospora cf. gigantea B TaxID=2853592 RepID=UPI003571CD24|nr:MAG: hypothetical protein KVP17_000112 [Porospora cf. gigantea B]
MVDTSWIRDQVALLLKLDASAVSDDIVEQVLSFDSADALEAHLLRLTCGLDESPDARTNEIAARYFARKLVRSKARKTRPSQSVPQAAEAPDECACQARDHKLAANCSFCGRIVCSVENTTACPSCGEGLGREAWKRKHHESLWEEAAFTKAVSTRDRIVEYDQQSAERTKVLDQATDWFDEGVDRWNSRAEREYALGVHQEMEEKLESATGRTYVALDVVNKTLAEVDWSAEVAHEAAERLTVFTDLKKKNRPTATQNAVDADAVYSEALRSLEAVTRMKNQRAAALLGAATQELRSNRPLLIEADLDDALPPSPPFQLPANWEFYEDPMPTSLEDSGVCLSLHQPWASLLVLGFKRLEGRSWYTDHRGPLWIHAASLQPDPIAYDMLVNQYAQVYENVHPPFPKLADLPTSALLGRVELVDVIENGDLSDRRDDGAFPQSESSKSPYVMYCRRPETLLMPVPMSGHHKLWKVDGFKQYARALKPAVFTRLKSA